MITSTYKTQKIIHIKIIHTIIWFVMAASTFYILYCGLTNTLNKTLFIAVSLLILETIVLISNRWACPLTIVAKKGKPDWKDGDDIFLPQWLAIHNKLIFGSILIVGLVLVLYRIVVKYL
jgi:hypothetical protein